MTPVALVAESCDTHDFAPLAKAMDDAAAAVGVNFIGGFSELVHKGFTGWDRRLIDAIPRALAETRRVCSSVNIATTKAGINMDAVALMGRGIKESAQLTAKAGGMACAKLVVFANAVEDNPFMAGAFHGVGEPECVINVGVSGPGVVYHRSRPSRVSRSTSSRKRLRKTAFRVYALWASWWRRRPPGVASRSALSTCRLRRRPAIGDSVADILEEMGLESVGRTARRPPWRF